MHWISHANLTAGTYSLRDLWTHEDLGTIEAGAEVWRGALKPHDNWAFKLTSISSGSTITISTGFFASAFLHLFLTLKIDSYLNTMNRGLF